MKVGPMAGPNRHQCRYDQPLPDRHEIHIVALAEVAPSQYQRVGCWRSISMEGDVVGQIVPRYLAGERCFDTRTVDWSNR